MSSYAFYEYTRNDCLEKGAGQKIIRPYYAGGRCVSAPLLKNQFYYSTRGNIWNNKYLVPLNRRKDQFGFRPDLEEFAKENEGKRLEKEIESEDVRMERFRTFRQNQLDLMEERRVGHEAIDYSRGGSGAPIPIDERHREKYTVKDNLYYHGRWNLWNNMSHSPNSRIALVVRPDIMKHDEEAAQKIDRNRQKEVDKEYAKEDYLGFLGDEDRSKLDHRTAIRQSFENDLYGSRRYKAAKQKHFIASERTEALAQPRKHIADVTGPDTPDYVGLITSSNVVPQIYQSLHRPTVGQKTKYSLEDWVERSPRSSDSEHTNHSDISYQLPDDDKSNNFRQYYDAEDEKPPVNEYPSDYISPDTEIVKTDVGTMFVNRSDYPVPRDVVCPDLAENAYNSVSETSLERDDRIDGMNHIDSLYKHESPPIDAGNQPKNRNPRPIQYYTTPEQSLQLQSSNSIHKIKKPTFNVSTYWNHIETTEKNKEQNKKKESELLPILQQSYPSGRLT